MDSQKCGSPHLAGVVRALYDVVAVLYRLNTAWAIGLPGLVRAANLFVRGEDVMN
jgi:hypothetical protein